MASSSLTLFFSLVVDLFKGHFKKIRCGDEVIILLKTSGKGRTESANNRLIIERIGSQEHDRLVNCKRLLI